MQGISRIATYFSSIAAKRYSSMRIDLYKVHEWNFVFCSSRMAKLENQKNAVIRRHTPKTKIYFAALAALSLVVSVTFKPNPVESRYTLFALLSRI